ncbi:hypothetical protein OG401_00245 [Kitasatospora purpeofusca]|uniref:hypothetical protein n=1 Tax=Kitasatospora purpeofusca TaxID=67352 RepID=UPI0022559D73|nr:hypothetical protein [Kitasatospora purpeofusca]MCX4682753.1 hypothetical protein [Kitasatospora purpeofusca]
MGWPFAALVIGIAIVSLAVQGRWLALNVQVPVILVAALERVTQPYSLGRIFAVTGSPPLPSRTRPTGEVARAQETGA